MNGDDTPDYSSMSLLDLFRSEAESQVQGLINGLLALDRHPEDISVIEPLMRAAHSLKGAARIVNLETIERLAHGMEDCFVAAQKGHLTLSKPDIDRLLAGVDLIGQIASQRDETVTAWLEEHKLEIANVLVGIYDVAKGIQRPGAMAAMSLPAITPEPARGIAPLSVTSSGLPAQPDNPAPAAAVSPAESTAPPRSSPTPLQFTEPVDMQPQRDDQVLKVTARNFDRLLSLAGETRVTAHAMQPYLQAMQRHKRQQHDLFTAIDKLQEALGQAGIDERTREKLTEVRARIEPLKKSLVERLSDFDNYERRLLSVSQEMLDEVLGLRMRPFREGVLAFPRMVRDLSRRLGKQVRLEIHGETTPVDRDILARMESPLNQLLRNAIDHGMETPDERESIGKPREGIILLEARHSGGMLQIVVSDDGRGADIEGIRRKIAERRMAPEQMIARMTDSELLEFLFLPAFSLKNSATEVSGRGVGLDVVHATIRELNGSVRMTTASGKGLRTEIVLPLSQSVVRCVICLIAGEPYAIPISKIARVLSLPLDQVESLEGRQYVRLEDSQIGLVPAGQLLQLRTRAEHADRLDIIVLGELHRYFGLVVDRILGEQSLVVQPVEQMFGKMRDISAAAVLEDGTPALILDVPDLLVSIGKLASHGALQRVQGISTASRQAKRILVVDDSLTVREMERKLLTARGFEVDVAIDGLDGWNMVRNGEYDLVVTDVDMPRMDGIEFVTLLKKDPRLSALPVMIVSYKDRPEDRARGIEAGADYYLTKGSFHDETLLEAVHDLIGEGAA
jgi:two-component system, chemotaxis family, sensor histidine kinase and response regulator WspE